MDKISKQAVLYILKPNTQYECADCHAFIPDSMRCNFHNESEGSFLPMDSCGFWVPGEPKPKGTIPAGGLTKLESGFVRTNFGVSCKRCEEFDRINFDCEKVDKDSPGDTPGMIHPDACCNAWEPDPERCNWPTDMFDDDARMPESQFNL